MPGFTFFLLKTSEHTWGGSYAGHMNVTQPDACWDNACFAAARRAGEAHPDGTREFYAVAERTWTSSLFLDAAVGALEQQGTGSSSGWLWRANGGKATDGVGACTRSARSGRPECGGTDARAAIAAGYTA